MGVDEWVAHAYAQVRGFREKMKFGSETEIDFFNLLHLFVAQRRLNSSSSIYNGEDRFEFAHLCRESIGTGMTADRTKQQSSHQEVSK